MEQVAPPAAVGLLVYFSQLYRLHPAQLTFGRDLRLPIDLAYGRRTEEPSPHRTVHVLQLRQNIPLNVYQTRLEPHAKLKLVHQSHLWSYSGVDAPTWFQPNKHRPTFSHVLLV